LHDAQDYASGFQDGWAQERAKSTIKTYNNIYLPCPQARPWNVGGGDERSITMDINSQLQDHICDHISIAAITAAKNTSGACELLGIV